MNKANTKRFDFREYLKYFLLALLLYWPLFGHLNTIPVQLYDEARLAMNAYEMLHNGNWIVTHFDGHPDMWNTKPPLMIWIQTLFMKVIGVNELAVRLPAAFAALATCMALLIFSLKYLNRFWFGFIAILVLISSTGYVNIHVTRTGDYESLLILFTTLSGLFFFLFTEFRKQKYLHLFFLFIALAVLTKGVAGLLFIPAMLLYLLIRRQCTALLTNKHFYYGLSGFLLLVFSYYLLRESFNPGYLQAVYQNELGGRYFDTIESHDHGFWFYFRNMITGQFDYWKLFFLAGILTGFIQKDPKIRRLTMFSLLMTTVFFLIISSGQTKLGWYNAPIFPFLGIITAVFLHEIFNRLRDLEWLSSKLKYNILPYLFLFFIFYSPYREIINKTYKPNVFPWKISYYEISAVLKDAVKGKYDMDGYDIVYQGADTHLDFYINILREKGMHLTINKMEDMMVNDQVIASQPEVKTYIESHFSYEIVFQKENVTGYQLNKAK